LFEEVGVLPKAASLGPKEPLQPEYNRVSIMQNARYALVAYVRGPVGEFVESLRRELHPELPHLAAHVTVLPPRLIRGTQSSALQSLETACRHAEPFEVTLGEVESFIPLNPTVFIRVAQASSRLCQLHDLLNTDSVACTEEWPYMPHLTIVKMGSEEQAKQALEISRERWTRYAGSRRIAVERLTFVREDAQNWWIDVAPVPLGGSLVSP